VYQTYYESGDLFTKSSSDLSWIGSIQAFLLLLVGALTGPIYDAGYIRALIISGSFLIVFGHMMLSLCHEFWQALLAQAFLVGIGAGTLFIPSVAKRRHSANLFHDQDSRGDRYRSIRNQRGRYHLPYRL